jgi:hypothetical protein
MLKPQFSIFFKKSIFFLIGEGGLNNDYRIYWRNFGYGVEELEMLCSKMNNVYFGCSPQILYNKKL